jgi:S-(hydroxymethyl)glutathione dehydrogenase / alcohol dehydrogenase
VRAAVCHAFGQPLVIEEVTLSPPGPGEVRVKMAAVGICHSDIHLIRGEWGGETPVIAGHEAAGTVDAVGDGVSSVKPGDRVVVSLLRTCGDCFYCLSGSPYKCEGMFALATEPRFHTLDGTPIKHGINTAAFAEYTVVDHSQLVVVPDGVSMEAAALLACGVITGMGAVTNTAGVTPGNSVVVIGAGGVGLNSVQGAAIAGANPVIAVDLLDGKLESACEFGATHGLNASRDDVRAQVEALTGRGADFVFVTVGDTRAAELALDLVRAEGTMVLVGMPPVDGAISLNIYKAVSKARRILGSPMGSTRLSIDVPRLISLYQRGRLKLDELVTQRFPFEQINEAIESSERGEALRNVVIFDD